MEQKLYDVAIIGGGPGGYTAGLYCARSGFSVVVLEKLSPGGQMATTGQVDNYPGFEGGVDGFELGEKMQRGAERFGVETRFAEVTGVELAAVPKVIQTSEGEVRARAVVLATGASPREATQFSGRRASRRSFSKRGENCLYSSKVNSTRYLRCLMP